MRRCGECGHWEPAGAPGCERCAALVDEIVEEGWRAFVEREFGTTDPPGERLIAEMVVDEPDRHPWRVVDAAYDRLTCPECGDRLSRGPAGCAPCDLANGFRYSAVEIDRPGVPPGNEHALRVNVAVTRRPYGISAAEVLLRRLSLPILLDGLLPTTAQAQATKAAANAGATESELAALVYGDWGRGQGREGPLPRARLKSGHSTSGS
ncbi:hypothetical protein SMD20_13915 [Nonomuraea sp. LP-02]|uniref:hypothetical protein n=1 Tax=Nonomuraea sp. LP-02 TaxID=3097960 RepID=UPI002E362A8D|nr:hypothetical protein [Nonomuraea sp. LP-02]MED7925344.1 hypothetical protein [Nonomuraea sp. LP-02]